MRWREFAMPTRSEFDAASLTPTYGKFIMEPFERGYALTVGNSLRRALLSSVEGAAVIAAKIDGVHHEFGTITGVLEDVMDVLLNLRQMKLRVHGEPPKTLRLNVSGEVAVKASHFEPSAEVEILNPDQHIATLTEKSSKLSLEVDIDVGRGFVPSEKNKRPEAPIGVIPLDATFSPVSRARYDVENTRVGQVTDFERLILEIWTDGRVSPEKALAEAGYLLHEHFAKLVKDGGEVAGAQQVKESERLKELVHKPIEELDLSVRALNSLHNESIKTIGDLVSKTDEDLLRFKNFGRKSLEEIRAALLPHGLTLGMDVSPYQSPSADAAVETAVETAAAPAPESEAAVEQPTEPTAPADSGESK